jgi:hypothetical protein
MTMTTLKTALLDLLTATGDPEFLPLIGGGYGIYLKYQQVLAANTRTLLLERPEARSTNDIDLFLRTELLIHGERLKPRSTTNSLSPGQTEGRQVPSKWICLQVRRIF